MQDIELTRGERFKDARIVHNRHGKQTLDEVAAATGVSKANLSAIENDKAGSIGADSVAALAKHYGVSADWLLGLTAIPRADSTMEAIERYTGMSETAVKRLSWKGMPNKRKTLNRLLSAEDFPAFLDALNDLETRVGMEERLLNASELPGNRKLTLKGAKKRLRDSVFGFGAEAYNFAKSVYGAVELEKKLDEAIEEATNGEHQTD